MPQDHRKQRKYINTAVQTELGMYVKTVAASGPAGDHEFLESVARRKKKEKEN